MVIQRIEQRLYLEGFERSSFKNRDGEAVSYLEVFGKPVNVDGTKQLKQQRYTASADMEDAIKQLVGKTVLLEVELKIETQRIKGVEVA